MPTIDVPGSSLAHREVKGLLPLGNPILPGKSPEPGPTRLPSLTHPGLGGLRKPLPASRNTAWQNPSFRGYADYMETETFRSAVKELEGLASQSPTAIMCAEAVPWRCHRSLIADALVMRGASVEHIMGLNVSKTHTMTPFARVEGLRILYPPDSGLDPANGR